MLLRAFKTEFSTSNPYTVNSEKYNKAQIQIYTIQIFQSTYIGRRRVHYSSHGIDDIVANEIRRTAGGKFILVLLGISAGEATCKIR